LAYKINYLPHTTNEDIADPCAFPYTLGGKTANINVKKTYQFKTNCKDDLMISLH